mmetsp:Transcript_31735/g.55222  ORF Transcript_31735/g.55222 Transcript_31735/m.55222 type:complete len:129 (-) Transcript_31735:36-422(-)
MGVHHDTGFVAEDMGKSQPSSGLLTLVTLNWRGDIRLFKTIRSSLIAPAVTCAQFRRRNAFAYSTIVTSSSDITAQETSMDHGSEWRLSGCRQRRSSGTDRMPSGDGMMVDFSAPLRACILALALNNR